jgi:cob(I)alamin adenosyltransferase
LIGAISLETTREVKMTVKDHATKIYTKAGDKGKTSLIGGTRVAKSALRLEAYGTLDELNSFIGVVMTEIETLLGEGATSLLGTLTEIQNDLFSCASQLACEDVSLRSQLPNLREERVMHLEKLMDEYSLELKPLRHFILPGGSKPSAHTHVARTVARRAERLVVTLSEQVEIDELIIRYLNRLSDYLFVLARHLNHLARVDEPTWGQRKGS